MTVPIPEKQDRLASTVAEALEAFQQRDGYQKAIIVEILEDFGAILAAPLLDRITAAEARAEEAETLAASWQGTAEAEAEIGAERKADRDRLADEVAHWKRIVVEAAIPLEAMQAAGRTADFSPELRAGVEHAITVVRRALTATGGTTDG